MCLSKAWLADATDHEPIMDQIARIRIDGERLTLVSLFGAEQTLDATVKEIDFTASTVILEQAG